MTLPATCIPRTAVAPVGSASTRLTTTNPPIFNSADFSAQPDDQIRTGGETRRHHHGPSRHNAAGHQAHPGELVANDLEGVRVDVAMLETPDSHGRLELMKFHVPSAPDGDPHAPANTLVIRRVAFAVDDIDAAVVGLCARGAELMGEVVRYQDSHRLCYVRGPEVILAGQIG